MNYEEQILELKKRIEFLEKAENKRIAKRKRDVVFGIGKIVLLIIVLVGAYFYVYNIFLKPYKEKVDYINNKIDSVEDFVNDKLNIIDKHNPFA